MSQTGKQLEKHLINPSAAWEQGSCYVYGAGGAGRLVSRILQKRGITIVACLDRNPVEKVFSGIPVLSPNNPALNRSLPIVIGVYNPMPDADHHRIAGFLKELGFHTIIPFLKFYADHAEEIGSYLNLVPGNFFRAHEQEIREAEQLWADVKSRELYHRKLAALTDGDLSEYCPVEEYTQYWPTDIPLPKTALRFADIGACDGDTIEAFLQRGVPLQRVYAFEPDPENFRKLSERIRHLDARIPFTLFPLGIGGGTGQMNFCASGNASAHIAEGGLPVTICRLDDILFGETPNYIKLDIEGFEEAALNGMRGILMRQYPMLAVSVYHKPQDIFRIPLLLKSWNYPASFYLRQHGGNFFDTVCYIVPAVTGRKRKRNTHDADT